MLDTQLLLDYAQQFFGYGNPDKTVWFIGIEEAGGRCEQVVSDRLKLWNEQFSRNSIIDAYEFHRSLHDCEGDPLDRLFRDPVPAQTTWDRLIRIQLALQGCTSISQSDVQSFRKSEWARSTSKNCLLELFPLPSPTVKTWHYDQWTTLENFQTRRAYQSDLGAKRTSTIKELIAKYRPPVVVFYGSRMKRWSEITGFPWKDAIMAPVPHARFQRAGETLYAVVRHPASWGANDADFDRIGEHIRSLGLGSEIDGPRPLFSNACPTREITMDDFATKDSWKTIPMSSQRVEFPLELQLTRDEFQRLMRGSVPEEMEDKWFVYHEDGWVYFHRSWTGFCIYQMRLVQDGDAYLCSEAWVTRDCEQYSSEDIDEDRQLLESLLFYRFAIGPDPSTIE